MPRRISQQRVAFAYHQGHGLAVQVLERQPVDRGAIGHSAHHQVQLTDTQLGQQVGAWPGHDTDRQPGMSVV
ncbi:hypothetical protein D3C84_896420 [compost metagenome]